MKKAAEGENIDYLVYDLGVYLKSYDKINGTSCFTDYSNHYSAGYDFLYGGAGTTHIFSKKATVQILSTTAKGRILLRFYGYSANFTFEDNRNFNVNFADGTRYAYDSEENPLKQVHATEYDDWMSAWSDNGVVIHGDGNDTLNGGEGNDVLTECVGSDYLYGGNGNDTYIFGIGYGSDIVEDNDGENKIVQRKTATEQAVGQIRKNKT